MTDTDATYFEHTPVMPEESVNYLITDPSGIYVDCTLGGGGHAEIILNHLNPDAHLYGLDQDDEALRAAKSHLREEKRFSTIKGNFGYLKTLLPPEIHGHISGFLFDLGLSTHQIKKSDRGFSFEKDGPLDMRMSNLTGISAYQVVNNYDYKKLRDVIFHYGEERKSREIAKAIISERPVESTEKLAEIVKSTVHGPHQKKTLARVFQGIRIEVNQELDMLRKGLEQALALLQTKGRIVAISYHSLEDRIVKRFFKTGNHEGRVEKDFYGYDIKSIEMLTRNVVTPSEEESSRNPASRSAKLRAARKIKSRGDDS